MSSIVAVICALVLVPTLVRAQQHLDGRRDPIRQSVRLNWNGFAPVVKVSVIAPAAARTHEGRTAVVEQLGRFASLHPVTAVDDALPAPPPVAWPDDPRGPPSSTVRTA